MCFCQHDGAAVITAIIVFSFPSEILNISSSGIVLLKTLISTPAQTSLCPHVSPFILQANNSANEWQQLFSSVGRSPPVRSVPAALKYFCIDVKPEQSLLTIPLTIWKWVHVPPQPPGSLVLWCITLLPLLPVISRIFFILYAVCRFFFIWMFSAVLQRCNKQKRPAVQIKKTPITPHYAVCTAITLLCVCLHACNSMKASTTWVLAWNPCTSV